jgi:hypothetical protein
MTEAEMKALVKRVKANIRVTKVVATRSIRGAKGDSFAGFSAAWNSVQPDAAGGGKDLIEMVDDQDIAVQGMTLQEARVAHYVVQQTADVAAYEAAMASGGIPRKKAEEAIRMTKQNYSFLISRALRVKKDEVLNDEAAAK